MVRKNRPRTAKKNPPKHPEPDQRKLSNSEAAGVPSDDTWRQFRYRWADPTPGDHKLAARAYDGDGVPQPIGPKAVAPDGAEGYHTIKFKI